MAECQKLMLGTFMMSVSQGFKSDFSREIDDQHVTHLAESIKGDGLHRNPELNWVGVVTEHKLGEELPTIRLPNNTVKIDEALAIEILSGNHRREACLSLGLDELQGITLYSGTWLKLR